MTLNEVVSSGFLSCCSVLFLKDRKRNVVDYLLLSDPALGRYLDLRLLSFDWHQDNVMHCVLDFEKEVPHAGKR